MKYEPELGQAFFAPQPWQEIATPDYVKRYFAELSEMLRKHPDFKNEWRTPFENSGSKFKNDVFEVEAYSWADCTCPEGNFVTDEWDEDLCNCGYKPQRYNFKWRDFEVSWYKHANRGVSQNREITREEALEMFTECQQSLKTKR